jgi:two-component system sensor histidine kinase ResE
MEQVFVNLLNNAFGHNPPGIGVQVTAEQRMSEVVISVLDDGIGMPQELMAAPFEAARRPNNGNSNGSGNGNSNGHGNSKGSSSNGSGNGKGSGYRKSAGAGLGLSIAKGIVQAHGGRIELAPLPKGTCFRIYLPVEAEMAGALAGSNGASGSDGTPGDGPATSGRTGDGDDD